MHRHQLTTRCDSEKLESFLRGKLSRSETEILELHLTECASCAAQLQRAAEQNLSWNAAQSLLAVDEFDSPQQSAVISSLVNGDSESMTKQQTADVLSREIRGWLDATDDPRSMGRFAGYEIVGIVGHGGMGIVLKGFEASLNRFVAIKILAPRLATNGSARKRFAREAQAAAAVRHENVIAIHRVDEWHGLPFLVMPYAGGISLQKRIDTNGPLSIEQTLRIGIQIASGLAAAHAQGLVHRDIKPANILVEQGVERVTITDFGLARAADDASLTRTGVIAGTPEYMSPEQAEAKPVDARSDLFSLGSVLYAMAAGRPPFTGSSSFEILKQIINEPARRLCDLQPSVPDWLEKIVGRLHSKSPSDRPSSANEVAELLQACLAHLQSPTTAALPESLTATVGSGRGHLRPWIAGLVSAAAFGFILLLASIVIVLEMNKGTLTIQCEADDVPIRIMQGNTIVSQLTISKEQKSIRIAAGQYEIVVDGAADGIVIKEGGNIELRRGETEVVRITYSENKNTSTPARTTQIEFDPPLDKIDNLPEGTEVHVVGCYGSTNRQSVTVKVAKTGKPQVVVLTSYFSSDWNLEIAPDADVRAVVLSGYFNQQFSNFAPRNIPTRILTYFPIWDDITQQEKQNRNNQCFYVWSPLSEDFGKMQSIIEGVTGRSITTFQGIYDAKSFSIDGTRGAEEARVAARWQSLTSRSSRDSNVFRKVLSQLNSIQKDYHSGLKPEQLNEMMRLMDAYEKTLPAIEDRTSLVTPGHSASGGVFSDRAWQKTAEYVAPDFNRFFPDSKEGSLALESMWNSPDRDSRSDEEVLKTFREGFRNTTLHRMPLLRWLGNRYIWGQSPQNPDAIEMMYHAADFRGESADPSGARHAAVYFGLSVTQPKTPAILRTLAELAIRVDDPNDLDRIAWGCSGQRAELLEYLKPFEVSDDEDIRKKADVCRRIFEGQLKAFAWATERAKELAQNEYEKQLPEFREILTTGTSAKRLETLQTILSHRVALIMDDSFVSEFSKCAADEDPEVRKLVAIIAGSRWVWETSEQNPEAIELMLKLSQDQNRNVKYNAVYYGLSTVRNKSDAVIHRLLELAFEDREPNLLNRVEWGLRGDRERVTIILNEYLNGTDESRAGAARELYSKFTGFEVSENDSRISPGDATDGRHAIVGSITAQDGSTVAAGIPVCLRDAETGLPVAKNTYRPIDWSRRDGGKQGVQLAISVTDTKGNFRFENVPNGKYKVIAQQWSGPFRGVFELYGADVRLLGTVDEITVPRPPDEQEAKIALKAHGQNTIHFNQSVPNNETMLFLSTAPPEFDPILGLHGLGTSFWQNMIGMNRMPLGKTTVTGVPNETIYAFLFAPDNSPGYATITIPPPESGTTYLLPEAFVAGWSNGRKTPPPMLAELIQFMTQHQLTTSELLELPELNNVNFEEYEKRMQELMADLSRVVELPEGKTARVGDLLAAEAYQRLQK